MQSMKGATKIIGGMNRSMNLPALSKIAQDFERENDIMEQRQEMMEDAVDDALGDPAEEEESEEVVQQILDELGVEFNSKVSVVLLAFWCCMCDLLTLGDTSLVRRLRGLSLLLFRKVVLRRQLGEGTMIYRLDWTV